MWTTGVDDRVRPLGPLPLSILFLTAGAQILSKEMRLQRCARLCLPRPACTHPTHLGLESFRGSTHLLKLHTQAHASSHVLSSRHPAAFATLDLCSPNRCIAEIGR